MSTKFLEKCRKGAMWPAFKRYVPQFKKSGRFSITQEEISAFVSEVDLQSDYLQEEISQLKDKVDVLQTKLSKAFQAALAGGVLLSTLRAQRSVRRKGVALNLSADQVDELEESVDAEIAREPTRLPLEQSNPV